MTPTRVHVSVAILRVVGFLWPLACGTDFWQRDATRKKRRPCQLAQWIFATPFSLSEGSVIFFPEVAVVAVRNNHPIGRPHGVSSGAWIRRSG